MVGLSLVTGEAPEVGDKVFGLQSQFCLEAAFWPSPGHFILMASTSSISHMRSLQLISVAAFKLSIFRSQQCFRDHEKCPLKGDA